MSLNLSIPYIGSVILKPASSSLASNDDLTHEDELALSFSEEEAEEVEESGTLVKGWTF